MTVDDPIEALRRRVDGICTRLPLELRLLMAQIEQHPRHNEKCEIFERLLNLLEQAGNEINMLFLLNRLHPGSIFASRIANVSPPTQGGTNDDTTSA